MIVDPVRRTKRRALDHPRLAAALAAGSGRTVEPANLPVPVLLTASSVAFQVGAGRFACDIRTYRCLTAGPGPDEIVSPDGRLGAFNVPPYSTYRVVDALIRANRDFDLIMFPNRRHGFGQEPYMMRRRWDYFVKNLLGAEPPKECVFGRLRASSD